MRHSAATQLAALGRALAHPLRVEILDNLRSADALSPLDLSRRLDASLGTIAYHIRYLHGLGMLELERAVPRRGTIQHFYSLKPPINTLLDVALVAIDEDSIRHSSNQT